MEHKTLHTNARFAEIVIENLGARGDGIGKDGDRMVFVEGGLPGDRLRVRLRPDREGVMRGVIEEILSPGADRAQAPCPHYAQCGGCSFQHMTQASYRHWKTGAVIEALARRGITPQTPATSHFVEAGTRRRATFVAVRQGGRIVLGYNRRRSHDVTAVDSCLILAPALQSIKDRLEVALGGLIRGTKPVDISIQIADPARPAADVVITGPLGPRGEPDLNARLDAPALADSCDLARLSWRAKDHDEPEILAGRYPVDARFGDLIVPLPPGAFLQPSLEGERALAEAVMSHLPARGRFADLFAGSGTFTGRMLTRGTVDAFENARSAVAALQRASGPRHPRATARDLFERPLMAAELKHYDAVVLDPPRAGAKEQAAALAKSAVPRIIYISCSPASFTRDAEMLAAGGYALQSLQIVDQFTWSDHVEIVGVFGR